MPDGARRPARLAGTPRTVTVRQTAPVPRLTKLRVGQPAHRPARAAVQPVDPGRVDLHRAGRLQHGVGGLQQAGLLLGVQAVGVLHRAAPAGPAAARAMPVSPAS